MLNYPNTIRVGGSEYDVILSDAPLLHPKDENVRLNGAALHDQRMMLLYANPNCPTSTEETFIHEVIEVAINVYDLQFVDPTTGKTYVMPHSAIKTLGVAIHQALAEARIDFGKSALNVTTH